MGHVVTKCKFRRDVVCHNCGKTGQVKKACRSKFPQTGNKSSVQSTHNNRSNNPRPVRHVQREWEEDESVELLLHQVRANESSPPLLVEVMIEEEVVTMEIDTGASMSIISEKKFVELWPRKSLL